jgi:predicted nucleotidyltransferase
VNLSDTHIATLIRSAVKKKDPSADVILFGSRARGESSPLSDWDILILLQRSKVNRMLEKEFRDVLFEVALEVGEPISTLVFSKNEWETRHVVTPLYQNVKKEGILL